MCLRVVAQLPQRLKSMFFEILYSIRVSFRDPPLENFSKSIDFSLWGKQCIVLPKCIFPHVFAHYAAAARRRRSLRSPINRSFFLTTAQDNVVETISGHTHMTQAKMHCDLSTYDNFDV